MKFYIFNKILKNTFSNIINVLYYKFFLKIISPIEISFFEN